MRGGAEQEVVAVGRHARDVLGREDAAGADDVVHHDDGALAEHVGQLDRHLAREHVGTAAGREGHDDPDRGDSGKSLPCASASERQAQARGAEAERAEVELAAGES